MSKNKGRQKGHGAKDEAPAMGGGSSGVESPEYDANLRAGEASRRLNAEPEVRVAEQTSKVRRTYEAVNLERQRLYDLLETLPAYVVLLSQDYRVPFANRFFRERFGESHGRCCFEYLFGRTEPCEICETYKVLKTNAPHRWEWTGPDGRIYDIYDFPFTDTDGSPLIMEMGIDITERKQAEEALKEAKETLEWRVAERTAELAASEERLRLAQDAANVGTWEWDLRTNKNFWSEKLWKLYGLEPYSCEASYETWRQTVHPDDRPKVEHTVREATRNRTELNAEWRVCLPSGAQRWLMSRGQPMRDAEGQVARYIGIVVDITERKRAEEALREAHGRTAWLARFPEENPNPVMRVLANGSALYCNPAAAKLAGWACEVGQPLVGSLLLLVEKAMTEGQEMQQDLELGGRSYFVSVTPFPAERYANIYGRDITERKRAEEALRQGTFELQQLTETLEQRVQERTSELARTNEVLRHLSSRLLSAQEDERKRLAGEIHDTLGASLSAIKFKLEDAREQIGKSGNAASESLNAIIPVVQESIDECRRIQMDLRPSMLDDLGLLVTLSWFCRRFQTIYSAIRIEQEIEIREDEVPNVLKTAIYRVTQEAMNNIAKHSHADLVRLSFRKMDGKMELTIQDNGWGFNLEKVRSQETMKRGLGLLSMRERTEFSGGSFAIESAEGKGTTIRASWPVGKE